MRAYKYVGTLFPILLAALLCASIVPDRLLADDKDTSSPSTKSAPAKSDAAKIEAPAPLTERERWLLDRVELLEKRVEELETKGSSPAVPAAAAAALQTRLLSPTPTTSATAPGAARGWCRGAPGAAAGAFAPCFVDPTPIPCCERRGPSRGCGWAQQPGLRRRCR